MGDGSDVPTGGGDVTPTRAGLLLNAGQYELVKKIGEGGMGEVYLARHKVLGRRVAIKLLHEEHRGRERHRARFLREAKTLATLQSEHIVAVTDFGCSDDGLPFMVMELLEGADLREILRNEGALAIDRALSLVLGACKGVGVAHRSGLVHRDIKPANLFIVKRPGGIEYCKVLDFGVAKQHDATALTTDGAMVGTVQYMAPEQVMGEQEVDERADVFALGCILYECVSGRPAFDADKREGILYKITHEDPKPLAEVAPGIPSELERVVLRALQREPGRRHQDIGEFAAELEQVLSSISGVLLARPAFAAGTGPRPSPPTRAGETSVDESLDGAGVSVHGIPGVQPTRKRLALMAVAFAALVAVLSLVLFETSEPRTGDARAARGMAASAPRRQLPTPPEQTGDDDARVQVTAAGEESAVVQVAPLAATSGSTQSSPQPALPVVPPVVPPPVKRSPPLRKEPAPIAENAADLSFDPNPYRRQPSQD